MRVTLVLPDVTFTTRIGGYRVHYETANRLAERGHDVTIIHKTASTRVMLRAWLWRARRRNDFVPWFSFSPDVRFVVVRRIPRRALRRGVCLFTLWRTMSDVPKVGRDAKAAALVWDYELWRHASPEERAEMRAHLAQEGLVRLAGSVAVVQMLDEMQLSSRGPYPPGVDTETFAVRRDPETRPPAIGFLHRPGPHRGLDDLMVALVEIRTRRDSLAVIATGRPPDADAPEWIEWRSSPTDELLAAFYNDLSVFVLPSHSEGLGLPALEAMACGTAVVTTDNGGSAQFARHATNALVVPPADPPRLAVAIEQLLDDETLRRELGRHGRATAEAMDWESAISRLEHALLEL
jgi:glycosyltransferase involved in cell wall biosynthesis